MKSYLSLRQNGVERFCENRKSMAANEMINTTKFEQRNISRVRHHVFGGYAEVWPMPLSPAELSIPLSIAMRSHQCPDGLFLASCWARVPWKLRFQKVHPLETETEADDISLDEVMGAHRCPSHLFLASSCIKQLRALYARVFPEYTETHRNIDLNVAMGAYRCPVHLFVASQYKDEYLRRHNSQQKEKRSLNHSVSTRLIKLNNQEDSRRSDQPSVQTPGPSTAAVEVKKHSAMGRFARRCLKSLRRISKIGNHHTNKE